MVLKCYIVNRNIQRCTGEIKSRFLHFDANNITRIN